MKKFVSIMVAMLMVVMLASTAFAASIGPVEYSDGYISFSVSGIGEDETLYIYVDGSKTGVTVDADNTSVKYKKDLEPGTHTVGFTGDKNHKSFLVEGTAPTTEAPVTEAPTTEAPVTEAPTTEAPVTEAPTTKAPVTEAPTTKAPTAAPDADDDVPKTGDSAVAAYIVAGMMIVAAAYIVLRRTVRNH